MAFTFEQALQYSQNGPFRDQNLAAGLKVAFFVVLDEDPGVANHAERLALAYAVINDPQQWSVRLATFCVGAADSFPAAIPTDATVVAVLTALWTKLALAYAASKAV